MRRIELSRKHGPFDPRWPALRRLKGPSRIDARSVATSVRGDLKRWESEGGALLPDARPTTLSTV
jgi:hypothetical protein